MTNQSIILKKVIETLGNLRKDLEKLFDEQKVRDPGINLIEPMCQGILNYEDLNKLLRYNLNICREKYCTVFSLWNFIKNEWFEFKRNEFPHHIDPADTEINKIFNNVANILVKNRLTLNNRLKYLYGKTNRKIYGFIRYDDDYNDNSIIEKYVSDGICFEENICQDMAYHNQYRLYYEETRRYVQAHFGKPSPPYGFLYLFTSLKGTSIKSKSFGGIFSIYTDREIDDEAILIIDILIEKIFDLFIARFYEEQNIKIKNYSIKSAIAAIMSRNMSHNLGSHILSTLGYEGVSAADDRILFKYIQQRMDYIALISTEIPGWTQSTWFLNDLMKRFYMQENLLKYLGHSEGLTAYYYKNAENKNSIEIKVNKKTGAKWGESENIIPGSQSNEQSQELEDFQVAIPGGVVGCHAFYTILENVIRNTAKHDWRKADNPEIKNLEITIEFVNNNEKPYIPFAIYSNIPLNEKNEKELIEIGEDNKRSLNNAFKARFIKDNGELKRENWGLGEIRISAGYLLKKNYSDIGFGGDDVLFKEKGNSFFGIIKAGAIEKDGKKFLGYLFALPKPKEVLFIGEWNDLKEKGEEAAKRCGIRFDEKIPTDERDYNFIIIEGNIFEQEYLFKENGSLDELSIIKFLDQFPARIFIVWNDDSNSELRKTIERTTEENQNPILRRRIISLTKEAFKKLGELGQDKENLYFANLKIAIYKRWIDHLAYLKVIKNLKIHVDLEGRGTDNSNEKEKKIFNYLFDNHRDKIISEIHYKSILYANIGIYKVKKALINVLNELFDNQRKEFKNMNELYSVFANQLPGKINEMKISQLDIEDSIKYQEGVNSFMKSVFDSIFKITEKLVYKDEEKIGTLPNILKEQASLNPDIKAIAEEINKFSPGIEFNLKIESAGTEDEGDIIYKRHTPKYLGNVNKQYCEALSGSQSFLGILCNYLKEDRIEGLQILLQLIENAFIQITIIDERARDFYLKRFKNSTDKFKSANIHIPKGIIYKEHDEYKMGFALQSECMEIKEKKESTWKEMGNGIYIAEDKIAGENEGRIKKIDADNHFKIDILIIHQGIIDKMDFPNVEAREHFLNALKKCIPSVIITSGRGDPMVPGTKFIPFSSIESFLMTDYPEKNLLIQTLMQIYKENK